MSAPLHTSNAVDVPPPRPRSLLVRALVALAIGAVGLSLLLRMVG